MSKMYTLTEENFSEVLNHFKTICNSYKLESEYTQTTYADRSVKHTKKFKLSRFVSVSEKQFKVDTYKSGQDYKRFIELDLFPDIILITYCGEVRFEDNEIFVTIHRKDSTEKYRFNIDKQSGLITDLESEIKKRYNDWESC